jgi:tyrosyl-tRNA synthetase
LTRGEVEAHAKTYLEQVFKVLDSDPQKIKISYNSEWCRPMSFEDVIRLASRYTVARILERDDFTNRLKEQRPISLHELLYPLIQGYDSVVLKSDVEMCGTDQKFNCLVGRALQEEAGQKPQAILAMPILEGLDGVKKMSKSLGNYVGVTDAPNEMFAKLMSVSDDLMWRYYELLSDLSEADRKGLRKRVEEGNYHPKKAKQELAGQITGRFHGKQKADEALDYFESRHNLTAEVDYPQVRLSPGGYKASDFLVKVGIAKSKSDAKRLIDQGAVEWVDKEDKKRRISAFNETIEVKANETGIVRSGKVFLKIVS